MILYADRARVVEVAKTWLRTPYVHMGRVKGAGCDCATLIAEVYEEAGLTPRIDIPYYSPQWHLHRDTERYLDFVHRYASEVDLPGAGDIVLFKFGRTYSHGAIITAWPQIIHAYVGQMVCYEDVHTAQWLAKVGGKPRPYKFLSYWAERHGLPDNANHQDACV